MPLTQTQEKQVESHIRIKILEKIRAYERETASMPFHVRLFGEDRMATYSFIQSCNTMLGQSIFEQVAEIIAKPHFSVAKTQYDLTGKISNEERLEIENILCILSTAQTQPDKKSEVSKILSVDSKKFVEEKSRVDLYLKDENGQEYFFDLITAKPNIKEFKELKRKLLYWTALRKKPVVTALAIPYNPCYPEPYERWTLRGLYDLQNEVFVEEDFWNMLGGKNTFNDLLEVFQRVGKELAPAIEEKIKAVAAATRKKSR